MKRTTSSGRIQREARAAFKPDAVRAFGRTGAGSQGGSLRGRAMLFIESRFMWNVLPQSALVIDYRTGMAATKATIRAAPLDAPERVGNLLCDLLGPEHDVFIEADSD